MRRYNQREPGYVFLFLFSPHPRMAPTRSGEEDCNKMTSESRHEEENSVEGSGGAHVAQVPVPAAEVSVAHRVATAAAEEVLAGAAGAVAVAVEAVAVEAARRPRPLEKGLPSLAAAAAGGSLDRLGRPPEHRRDLARWSETFRPSFFQTFRAFATASGVHAPTVRPAVKGSSLTRR